MLARTALLQAGHTEVAEAEADLHVINTCCITSEAESKSRQSTRRSLKQANRVIVAGCAVNLDARRFGEIDPRVTPVVGTADAVAGRLATESLDTRATESLARLATGPVLAAADQRATEQPNAACADVDHDILWRNVAGPRGRTRGFVKVQDGCDCHCAYCIIPTVRGQARSRAATAILDEVRRRVSDG